MFKISWYFDNLSNPEDIQILTRLENSYVYYTEGDSGCS